MVIDMINAKCGDVFLFGGIQRRFLDTLENLYGKPIDDYQFAAVHTFAIFITKQEKKGLYYLFWKPFLGFRWLNIEYVHSSYVRLEDASDFDRKERLNISLSIEEIGFKQKDFNKWRGLEQTNRLVEYLSQKEVTERFQHSMQEVSEGFRRGVYRPKDVLDRMTLDRILEEPGQSYSIQEKSGTIGCPHCKARYAYKDSEKSDGSVTCKNCNKSFDVSLD